MPSRQTASCGLTPDRPHRCGRSPNTSRVSVLVSHGPWPQEQEAASLGPERTARKLNLGHEEAASELRMLRSQGVAETIDLGDVD